VGLRQLADGRTPSPHDIVIFGGPHADLPITPHAGALIGETVAGMKREKMMHNKTEIVTTLDTIASQRLFGDGRWLVDRAAAIELNEAINAMGLQEQVSENTSRDTALGKEVNLSLQMAFMGLWEPWDMIYVLEEHRLLDEDEVDHLCYLLERSEEDY
jgi:hypothetical protein